MCGAPVGREEVSARVIESCLSHSETIIVYLCLHSLWAGAFSIEDEGVQGRAREVREGWVGPPKGLIAVGLRGSSSKFHWNLNWEWRVGEIEVARRFFEPSKGEHGLGRDDKTNMCLASSQNPHFPLSVSGSRRK